MTVFLYCLLRSLRHLALPLLLGLGLSGLCLAFLLPPTGSGEETAVGSLLHLPAFLLAATCLASCLSCWPMFPRGHPATALLQHLRPGPWHGCVAAALGSLLALAMALALLGLLFPSLLQVLGFPSSQVRSRLEFAQAEKQASTLQLLNTDPRPLQSIQLQAPVLGSSELFRRPTRIQILGDGQALHADWLALQNQTLQLALHPPRAVQRLEIRFANPAANLSSLHSYAVRGISAQRYAAAWNGLLACMTYLCPAALALGLCILLQGQVSLAIALALGLCTLLLSNLLEITPVTAAFTAFAQHRWLLTENLGQSALTCLFWPGLLVVLGAGTAKLRVCG